MRRLGVDESRSTIWDPSEFRSQNEKPLLSAFATPKSIIFGTGTSSCIVTMMFEGFKSR
jgi:hypothetical protein